MTPLHLDWSTAQVSDGRLTVGFNDKASKKWREAFSRTALLLSGETWQVGEVKARTVRVSPMRLGEEERVKHFLESAVFEANATCMSEEELFDADAADEDGDGEEGAEASPDEELTARFRAFG